MEKFSQSSAPRKVQQVFSELDDLLADKFAQRARRGASSVSTLCGMAGCQTVTSHKKA